MISRSARKLKTSVSNKMAAFAGRKSLNESTQFIGTLLSIRNCYIAINSKLRYHGLRFLSSHLPADVKNRWKRRFREEGIPDADESVKWIADHLMKSNVTVDLIGKFNRLCEKRINREPVQYIVGDWDFRFITLKLRRPVFIPRPETEGLIDLISDNLDKKEKNISILEVGCGSGAISLSLAKENQNVFCTAIDVSSEAFELAKENCTRLSLSSQVKILNHSLDEYRRIHDNKMKFDIIVSNPPYIPTDDMAELQAEIAQYEDHRALHGGEDGLDIIVDILSSSNDFLSNNGQIWLEVHTSHPSMIERIVADRFHDKICYVTTYNDIFKRPRFTFLRTVK